MQVFWFVLLWMFLASLPLYSYEEHPVEIANVSESSVFKAIPSAGMSEEQAKSEVNSMF